MLASEYASIQLAPILADRVFSVCSSAVTLRVWMVGTRALCSRLVVKWGLRPSSGKSRPSFSRRHCWS